MIYVVGSINTDLVMKSSRMPQKGETLMGDNFFINQGGKGANQAVAVAKSGSEVTLIGAIGNDNFGQEALASLELYGVNTSGIHKVSGHTGVASIWLTEQDNRILIDGGANQKVTEEMIFKGLANAKPNDIVLLQLEIPMSIVLYTLKLAKQKQMITCLNPAPFNSLSREILNLTDILCVNETEYEALINEHKDISVSIRIQTLGHEGVKVTYQNNSIHFKAHKVKVVDTTAAGDTFIGAFIARYSKTNDVFEATKFANAAAALCVTKYGAQQSIPLEKDTLQLMEDAHD